MKVKIFKYYEELEGENKINEWLQKNNTIQIMFINTNTCPNNYGSMATRTIIFYCTRKDKLENLKQLEE